MGQLYLQLVLGILALLMAGCAAKGSLQPGDFEEGNGKKPLSYFEATLRPSDFDEDVEIIRKAHAESGDSTPIEIPEDSTIVEEKVSQGFRIQIFASSNIDEANSSKALALRRVDDDSVYIVYDPPVYKVRVGDYSTKLEANQQLNRFINRGYPDAWVVADRIVERRVVRIPKQDPR